MNQSRVFLEALFCGKPDELFLLIWTLPEKASKWFRDIDDAVRCAESLAACDAYAGVGLASRDYGSTRRCEASEIAGLVGVWADIDLRSDAHAKAALPGTVEQALAILPPEFLPTFIVLTGNGVHVWWLFKEPYVFENDEDRKRAASLTHRWSTLIRDNARLRGWAIDRLGDLARVLRIPGTQNCKDPANPKPVTIHSRSDHRYNPSELLEYLDDMNVPDQYGENNAGREWAQHFQNKPIAINLAARIPDDLLSRWLEKDTRFKSTWFRQRSDLSDQSQSGYDLALANFGLSSGLAEQQIVDLIIHHRAMHKQKPRTRLDYFYRTLSTAANRGKQDPVGAATASSAPESQTADPRPETSEPPPAMPPSPISDREKVELCDRISEELGVEILRMVKLDGKEPVYRMELAEGKIHFDNVGKLISQTAVQAAIAARTGILIHPFKAASWRRLVQWMLDACVVEEASEELECEGAARLSIAQYLSETPFISSIEGQSPLDLRKPMEREDRITVCASDLQMFINKTTQQNLPVRAVAAMLSAIGAKTIRVRGKKIREQSRWELPLEEFDPAEYARSEDGSAAENK